MLQKLLATKAGKDSKLWQVANAGSKEPEQFAVKVAGLGVSTVSAIREVLSSCLSVCPRHDSKWQKLWKFVRADEQSRA